MGVLPFTPVVYGGVCPTCISSKSSFEAFSSFVRSGLLIPVLTNDYADYPAHVSEFILSRDHVSRMQFALFRHHTVYRYGVTKNVHESILNS